jgi:hypothetical protein
MLHGTRWGIRIRPDAQLAMTGAEQAKRELRCYQVSLLSSARSPHRRALLQSRRRRGGLATSN